MTITRTLDSIQFLVECIPCVAITAMLLSVIGFSMSVDNAPKMFKGLKQYGIQTDKFEDYVMSVASIIFIFNVIVTAFALFSTGCCRERLFIRPRGTCAFFLKCFFGTFAQAIFFVVSMVSTIISFIAVILCTTCFVVAGSVHTICVTDLKDENGTTLAVQGQDIVAQIVQNINYPRMMSEVVTDSTSSGDALCRYANTFSYGSKQSYIGFALILFAQILFVTKIVHTFVAISFEMTMDNSKYDEEERVSLTAANRAHLRKQKQKTGSNALRNRASVTEMSGRV